MKAPIRTLFTLAVPLALAAGAVVWLKDMRAAGPAGYTYDTVAIERGEIRRIVTTSGPVRAVVTVSVGSQLSGQIKELLVDFNSEVKAGDVLAVLDDRTFAAKVAQARADIAAARAQLVNQEAALERSKAMRRAAERTQGRQQALANKGYAAQSSLDTAVRDLDAADADIAVGAAQIKAAAAAIAQREALLLQAEIDLARTRISSPIDGTVIARTIDVGQTVAASLQAPELFRIAQDLRRIQIEAQVNEADVGQVKSGNPVRFRVDAYPERQFVGTVSQVRLAATELQNVVTYTVIIEAENDDRVLYPGMTANVEIETARRSDVLRVASEALRFRPRDDARRTTLPDSTGSKSAGDSAGARGDRTGRLVAGLKTTLSLTDAQVAALTEKLTAARGQGGRGGGGRRGGGSDGAGADVADTAASGDRAAANSQREARQQRLEQTILSIITPEQRPAFENWKARRGTVQTGAVWTVGADNALGRLTVRLGLSDGQYSEILRGDVEAGQRVAVRTRKIKGQ